MVKQESKMNLNKYSSPNIYCSKGSGISNQYTSTNAFGKFQNTTQGRAPEYKPEKFIK